MENICKRIVEILAPKEVVKIEELISDFDLKKIALKEYSGYVNILLCGYINDKYDVRVITVDDTTGVRYFVSGESTQMNIPTTEIISFLNRHKDIVVIDD